MPLIFEKLVSEKVEMQQTIQSSLKQGVQRRETIMPMIKFINNVRNR